MGEAGQPQPPQPPHQPASTIEAAGQVASDVVAGLKQQPMMLSLVLINLFGIAAALYFLEHLARITQSRTEMILKACLPNAGGG